MAQEKELRDQALKVYLNHRAGNILHIVSRYNDAVSKHAQAATGLSSVESELRSHGQKPRTTPLANWLRTRHELRSRETALRREQIRAWMEWVQANRARHAVYGEVVPLVRAGFGPIDFEHRHLQLD